MIVEPARAARKIRTACQNERIGRARRAGADPHPRFIVLEAVVEIFDTDREIAADLLFDAAAGLPAPAVIVADHRKGIGGIAAGEAVVELRIGATERAVEQRLGADRIPRPRTQRRVPVDFAGHRVESGRGAERGHAVAHFRLAEFTDKADDELAILLVGADAQVIFDIVLVVGARGVGVRGRSAVTEPGRKGVGAARRRDRFAKAAIRSAIEQNGFVDVVVLDAKADRPADIETAEFFIAVLGMGWGTGKRQGQGACGGTHQGIDTHWGDTPLLLRWDNVGDGAFIPPFRKSVKDVALRQQLRLLRWGGTI